MTPPGTQRFVVVSPKAGVTVLVGVLFAVVDGAAAKGVEELAGAIVQAGDGFDGCEYYGSI